MCHLTRIAMTSLNWSCLGREMVGLSLSVAKTGNKLYVVKGPLKVETLAHHGCGVILGDNDFLYFFPHFFSTQKTLVFKWIKCFFFYTRGINYPLRLGCIFPRWLFDRVTSHDYRHNRGPIERASLKPSVTYPHDVRGGSNVWGFGGGGV